MNESEFRNLVSGRTKSVLASFERTVLYGASAAYWLAVRLRNELYDRGWKSIHRADVPVISIGNVTTGGTGKTPLVALICRLLQEFGLRPGIVSRGYRSVNGAANDEKLVLNLLCPGIPHEQNPDRMAAAAVLTASGTVDALVMDDGFQHRRLHRDLNLVLIDATNPFGYEFLLPRGLLREPLSSLERADVVIITRSDLVSDRMRAEIERSILAFAPKLSNHILHVSFQPTVLRNTDGSTATLCEAGARTVHLMAGIGNPDAFRATVVQSGMQVSGTSWFPDHHHYSPKDLQRVRQQALASGNAPIVTTLKDLVKLPREARDVRALEIAAVIPDPHQANLLSALVRRAVSR